MSTRTRAGTAVPAAPDALEVRSPFDDAVVGEAAVPSDAGVEAALAAATAAAPAAAASGSR